MKLKNRYYILRHGESSANVKDIHSCWPEKIRFPLTSKGRKEIETAVSKLKKKDINLIFSSDILRTKQTAEMVSKELRTRPVRDRLPKGDRKNPLKDSISNGVKPEYDKRLREVNVGIFNERPIEEFRKFFPRKEINKRFRIKPKGGETYKEVEKRMFDFLKEINKKYKGKNILIVSHQAPLTLLEAKIKGISNSIIFKIFTDKKSIKTGELRTLQN